MSEEGVAEGMNGMRKQRRVLAGGRLQGGQGGGAGGWVGHATKGLTQLGLL